MSTHGQITFVTGTAAKRSYCHWDGYADGLGVDVLTWLGEVIASGREGEARQQAERLQVVNDAETPPPTAEQLAALAEWTDGNVGGPSEQWYRAVRKTQGDPVAILACGYAYYADAMSEVDEHYNYVVDFARRELRFHSLVWPFDTLPAPGEFVAAVEAARSSRS
jgi:hypothetical protein